MIQGIQDAFEASLPELAWMDEATRKAAIDKKNTLRNKIGYPEVWKDYSGLTVDAGNHAANALAASRFDIKDRLSRVGKPADPNLWHMAPAMVNAYYHPLYNEMAYPAGILQPPFFDRGAPAMMNFGAIGMVMGHELTHGFDDGGAQFDGDGRLVQWWNDQAVKKFGERTQCVVDQYNGYTLRDDLKVNGELTQGENIADLGGLKQSYYAFLRREPKAKEPSAVPGLTNEQLFFVAFAQGWCSKITPQMEQLRVTTDPHSPPRFRVNGPASAFPEFAKAFSCKDGAPMAPTQRCTVW
jgi:endothelin-converting enzyme/putative endopeptidase